MRRPDQKSFCVDVDSKLIEEFTEQCGERGFKKYRTLEGAIRLWLTLSPTEQLRWIEGKPKPKASEDELVEKIRQFERAFATLKEGLNRRCKK